MATEKGKKKKGDGNCEKKGLRNQQDGNENPEENEGRWELRVKKKEVTERRGRNVTGIAKKRSPKTKGRR